MTNAVATMRLEGRQSTARKKLTQDIIIGKDILELVSAAMYVEPLTIVREYVQNAVDAIDIGEREGLYSSNITPRVDIVVDIADRKLRIRDNGVGVSNTHFARRLTAFGASQKRGTRARGFRGVGRLAGLGYCQELIFRSRTAGDPQVYELTWDGKRFKEILRDPRYKGDLSEVVREVASIITYAGTGYPKHFFEVELRGLIRHKNDQLLNEHEIQRYLEQHAPVPFHPEFEFATTIGNFLEKFGVGHSYDIFVGSTATKDSEPKQVFRPYRDQFVVSGRQSDRFADVDLFEWTGIDGELAVVGWALDHNYYGAIPKSEGIKGFRLRSGNIQVGPDDIAADLFPEPRFNSWMVGEIHVISPKLVPNGRRDAFESNAHFAHLQGNIAAYAKKISKICRGKSVVRNRDRRFELEQAKIEEKLSLLSRSSLPRSLKEKLRKEIIVHVKALEKLVLSISDQKARRKFEHTLARIKHRAGKNLDHIVLKDPLAKLPKAKQDLYRQVIAIVFECAPNRNAAGAMVERIFNKLMK